MSQSKVCPREPTEGMIAAGTSLAFPDHWDVLVVAATDIWRAMYDAAPAPPQADAEAQVHATPDEQRALRQALFQSAERVEHPAEVLLRALMVALDHHEYCPLPDDDTDVYNAEEFRAARDAARAYLAAKDAP